MTSRYHISMLLNLILLDAHAPIGAVINKLNRALGVTLPKVKNNQKTSVSSTKGFLHGLTIAVSHSWLMRW